MTTDTPKIEFKSLPLAPELKAVLVELGFVHATPIQSLSLPALLEGKDLIGQSKTGSGKTLAFTLPMLQRLDFRDRGVQALVLSPTRELAVQVTREIRKLGRKFPSLKVVTLVGGQPFPAQAKALHMGAHIAVGTPGRVLDHIRRQSIDLTGTGLLVLDEADRMLDMGFQEEMDEILLAMPAKRQTVLFSATFPASIEELSQNYQSKPIRVTVEDREEDKPLIRQLIYEVNNEDKLSAVRRCLQEHKPATAIIFCNLKITVAGVAEQLSDAGVSAASLHGDLEQTDRDRVMAMFRNRSVRVLVATDVAARGIDVADLDLVINFDLPKPDIYVHRIGRTGRAGKTGLAVSFMLPDEKYKVRKIEELGIGTLEQAIFRDEEEDKGPDPLPAAEAMMCTLYISGGRKDKMRPGDILGALTGEAGGLAGKDVGKIEIHDRFSYVAVAKEIAETALQRLRDGKIKGRKFRVEKVV